MKKNELENVLQHIASYISENGQKHILLNHLRSCVDDFGFTAKAYDEIVSIFDSHDEC